MSFLWGASGGIPYHLAAFRFRHSLWAPFITGVNDWLCDSWKPRSRDLLIFGSSAAWTLKPGFLERFSRVVAVEPDPLAGLLLRQRFPRVEFTINERSDLLPWFTPETRTFFDFLQSHSSHAVLFSNILGQIGLFKRSFKKPDTTARAEFWRALRGREWASYHDILSSTSASLLDSRAAMPTGHEDITEYAARFFHDGATLTDHETLWLTVGRPWQALTWDLRPHQHHIVGCVHEPA